MDQEYAWPLSKGSWRTDHHVEPFILSCSLIVPREYNNAFTALQYSTSLPCVEPRYTFLGLAARAL